LQTVDLPRGRDSGFHIHSEEFKIHKESGGIEIEKSKAPCALDYGLSAEGP
jgi:hypothetical protein